MYVKRNIVPLSCSGKPVSILYSECISVAFIIQHAMRMRHIVISVQPPSTTFSTLFYKWQDFRQNGIELKMRVLIFCTNFFRILFIIRIV
jgi:hypothetical protein